MFKGGCYRGPNYGTLSDNTVFLAGSGLTVDQDYFEETKLLKVTSFPDDKF